MTPRRVSVVPHTHWDREWYAPFQSFRMRLVDLLDGFLDHLEADPDYRHFLLDGQMAVVDDYLEVRPEAEARLRDLARSGRLAAGPWYILMDEFLVSGETIWRNLQMGMERADDFGGPMPVGYLPDMFGHVAQMPQILRHAGLAHAVVWRGVPSAINRTGFWWEAPDGSRVRAEYLPDGYGNGARLPEDASRLVARVADHADAIAGLLPDGAPLLLMNGTDHQTPQPWLPRVLGEANASQNGLAFEITSLPDHLAAAPIDGLPCWQGELRSGSRANLLMGVASNRTDVKQAAARTERQLERLAEPLSALFADSWPTRMLHLAWREVVRNSAHDSICACSHDEVVDAVLHRYAEARQIAEGLTNRALRSLGRSLAEPGTYAVNPSARSRSGLIEVEIDGAAPEPGGGVQVVARRDEVLYDAVTTADDLPTLLKLIRSQQLDDTTFITSVDVDDDDDALRVTARAEGRLRSNLLVEEIKSDIVTRARSRPERPVHMRIVQRPSARVLVRTPEVAGFGWARVDLDESDSDQGARTSPATASATGLANGLVTVEVDTDLGTLTINGRPGFDRLVDGGDHGDTYNYSPPDHDVIVDRPDDVRVEVEESGPLRARLRVRRTFRWPASIDDDVRARTGELDTTVTTAVEVRVGEPFVRIHTTFNNQARDHRLRAHFPLPDPAATSRAECAFAVVERGLEAEGGPTERGLATYPSRRFVQAGGLTVVHEGLLEYELVDIADGRARELALTLLRATGMLSRVEMAYRPMPAGPPDPLEGPQMCGPVEARYAVSVDPTVDPHAMADDVFLPLVAVPALGGGSSPPQGSALRVEGAQVSAVRQTPAGLEVRVFNPTSQTADVTVSGTGRRVDLRGRDVGPFDGRISLTPWAIETLAVNVTRG